MNYQTSKLTHWVDETGQAIPFNRLKPIEKQKEKTAYNLALKAKMISKNLTEYKAYIAKECSAIYDECMKDAKPGKGNFTFYNFDMTIKIEVQINDNIDFDSILIEQARQKLLDLIGESISADKEFIKELIMSAFQTSGGKLDTKKVIGLKKHAQRIKDVRYHEAMDLIDQSIRRPTSKTYFRVWVKSAEGKYENIDLNFSSI